MARPNKLEPLIKDALRGENWQQGMLAEEIAAEVLAKTKATPRGVQNALLSMFNKGHVGRAYEYVYDERGRPILRRMRYWNPVDMRYSKMPEGYQQLTYDDKPRREK
jgi:hypothetical protein